jgi:hypothetical protein
MTAGDLLAIIRYDYLDDAVEPYAWRDELLLREIGRAQQQACWRQDLRHLFDESFSISLIEGQRSYPLDPLILRIEQITLNNVPLLFTTRADLDARLWGWRTFSDGAPERFYIDGRTLKLDRAPSATEAGSALALHVWRGPLTDPADITVDDDLEWEHDPEQLAHWVCHRAYLRRDEDTQNKEASMQHLAMFSATFGAEVPAKARAELLMYPADLTIAPARRRPLLGEHEDW